MKAGYYTSIGLHPSYAENKVETKREELLEKL